MNLKLTPDFEGCCLASAWKWTNIMQLASRLQIYLGGENSTDFLGFSHFWDNDGAGKSSFICGASAMEGAGTDSISRPWGRLSCFGLQKDLIKKLLKAQLEMPGSLTSDKNQFCYQKWKGRNWRNVPLRRELNRGGDDSWSWEKNKKKNLWCSHFLCWSSFSGQCPKLGRNSSLTALWGQEGPFLRDSTL